jgi:outer membrane protein assembly factor BamB
MPKRHLQSPIWKSSAGKKKIILTVLIISMFLLVGISSVILSPNIHGHSYSEYSLERSSVPTAQETSLANSPWPIFRANLKHTGLSPYNTSENDGHVIWTYSTGDDIWSSPTIGEDSTIYVGSKDRNLYAIYPNGTLKWKYTTGGYVHSSATIGSDGTIYVGSYDDNLYAIYPNGTLKWKYRTGGDIASSPAIGDDGTIYFGSKDDKFYALYPNGTLKWSYTTNDGIWSSPAIADDGTIYVGSRDHTIYAFHPDGTLKWSYTTGGYACPPPTIGNDGTIYEGSGDHKLYALNPNGTLKWAYTAGDEIWNGVAIDARGNLYFGCQDHKLYALYPNGTLKWTYTTGNEVIPSPAVGSDGTIYVGSRDHKLYAINPNGTLKWEYTTEGEIYASSPAIGSDGTVYVGSCDNKLYAFNHEMNPPQHSEEHPIKYAKDTKPTIWVHITDDTKVNESAVQLYVQNSSVNYTIEPIAGGYNISYDAPGFSKGEKIICRVLAEDIYGNKLDYSWSFTVLSRKNITVHQGWNLITIRWSDEPVSINTAIDGNWTRAMTYINGTWHTYDKNRDAKYNLGFPKVDSTMGLWIYSPYSDTIISYYLNTPRNTTICLHKGWNLVGYPSSNDSKVSDALSGVPWIYLQTADADGNLYSLSSDDYLIVNRAYWIYVTSDGAWTVEW